MGKVSGTFCADGGSDVEADRWKAVDGVGGRGDVFRALDRERVKGEPRHRMQGGRLMKGADEDTALISCTVVEGVGRTVDEDNCGGRRQLPARRRGHHGCRMPEAGGRGRCVLNVGVRLAIDHARSGSGKGP